METTLHGTSVIPLYEQLAAKLQSQILSDALKPGDKLPSEADLCQSYGVSRVTVRSAIDRLVECGVLERRQGKGTFVAAEKVKMSMVPQSAFSDSFTSSHYGTVRETQIISKERRKPTEQERVKLGLDAEEGVLVFYRRMLVDGSPWMLDRTVYPENRFPGLYDLVQANVSTYKLLRESYGMCMKSCYKELSFCYATREQGDLLGCAEQAPLFKSFKIVYDENKRPIHLSTDYIRAESVVLSSNVEMKANPD